MVVRNTGPTREVLNCLVSGHNLYGLDVMRITGLASGTVYPILRRLEGEGFVTSYWEEVDPSEEGRPRRRIYEITADGANAAARFSAEVEERKRRLQRDFWPGEAPA